MSSEATRYVRRHIRGLGSAERMVLQTIADRCRADGTTPRGKGPSHRTLAEECESSERTIRRWVDALVLKGVLLADGRCTYAIPGISDHDPYTCGNTECYRTAETVEQRANERAIRNRPEMAANHSRSSSDSGQIWHRNRPEMAAKTFSLSERDLAPGGAQGFAPRSGASVGAAAGVHAYVDDVGCCGICGLPQNHARHRTTTTTSTGDHHAQYHADAPLPGEVPGDLRAGPGGRPSGTGSGEPPDAGDRSLGGGEAGAGAGPEGGADHAAGLGTDGARAARPGGADGAAGGGARPYSWRAVSTAGGRSLMIPAASGTRS